MAARREVELFDLAADPDETKNLAASEPEIVRQLTQSRRPDEDRSSEK